MLQIEVTESPDQEMMGEHTFYKRLLFFGQNQGDILFQDTQIQDNHLRLEFTEEGLFCFKNSQVPFYLVNGKRTTGKKLLAINDEVAIGETKFIIKNLHYIKYERKGALLENNLNLILSDPSLSDVKEIIDILEQDLAEFT